MNRLDTLHARRERLIIANLIHKYAQNQSARYCKILLAIRKEEAEILYAHQKTLSTKPTLKFTREMMIAATHPFSSGNSVAGNSLLQ